MQVPLPGLIRCRALRLGEKLPSQSTLSESGDPADHSCLSPSPQCPSLPWRPGPSSQHHPHPRQVTPPSWPCPGHRHRPTGPGPRTPGWRCRGCSRQQAASWFPSGQPRALPLRAVTRAAAALPRRLSPDSDSAGAMGRGACVPSAASGAHDRARLLGAVLGALCLLPTLVLLARPGALGNRPVASAAQPWLGVENQKMPKDKGVPPWRERQRSLERAPSHPSRSISSRLGDSPCCLPTGHLLPSKGDAVPPTVGVLTTPSLGPPHPPAPRRRRYTLTPTRLHWDHFNLTYRILSFPRNLLSPRETRRGLAAAFRMWSDVSPFSFREVAPEQPSDLRIGFYPVNHTDCLVSPTHHCFDGPTGELAHAFFPPHGGIHFDDSEYWVLGPTRYSWKKGAVAGRAVGVAPALRLPGPAVRVRVLGAEGFLRRPPEAHEEAVPQQLRLLLRVPLPHGGCHRTAPQDQNPAGARGQECDLPLRPEDPPQERQSVVSDPAWAPEGGRGTRDPAQPSALPAAGTRTRSPWSSPTPATWRWATRT
ncbi:matrix metalloproteinase-23 isoform X3 [Lagenorhynchus albirostris]|uniref:matrix metalloproteinase-23 isoform X3 n=1 Tax=Lagenorhynchus albirostris TaxID=27610 RepID=UPI0028E76DA7|nr:matrix metalloproteinase-23 isoform X3 [Lagenorhynchus albirostris]